MKPPRTAGVTFSAVVVLAWIEINLPTAAYAFDYTVYALNGSPASGLEEDSRFSDFDRATVSPGGHVVFVGTASNGSNSGEREGLWSISPSGLELVVSSQSTLPGFGPEARIYSMIATYVHDDGDVLFLSLVSSAEHSRELVVWNYESQQLRLIARATDFAPTYPNNLFAVTTGAGSTPDGKVLYTGGHDGVGSYLSLWLDDNVQRQQILREGDPSPADPEETISILPGRPGAAFLHPDGTLTVQVKLAGIDGPWQILSGPPNDLHVTFESGTPAPGISGATLWYLPYNGHYSSLRANDFGEVGFLSAVSGTGINSSNDGGYWAGPPDALRLVAREGQQAPGMDDGYAFNDLFQYPDLYTFNNNGDFVFVTDAAKDNNGALDRRQGLWREIDGELQLAVAQGMQVPGLPEGTLFSGLGWFQFNSAGQVVFGAAYPDLLAPSGQVGGIWEAGPDGIIEPVLVSGMELEVSPGEFRTVSGLLLSAPNSVGRLSQLSDGGQFVTVVSFQEEGSAILGTRIPIPEPSTFILALSALALLSASCRE